MFNMSDDNLVDELQSAVAWRQRHLIEFDDMVRRYHGSSYMDDGVAVRRASTPRTMRSATCRWCCPGWLTMSRGSRWRPRARTQPTTPPR